MLLVEDASLEDQNLIKLICRLYVKEEGGGRGKKRKAGWEQD